MLCINNWKDVTYQNVMGSDDGANWTNSVPDLQNSQSDPLIESVLEPAVPDAVDANNRAERLKNRHDSIFALFPPQSEVND